MGNLSLHRFGQFVRLTKSESDAIGRLGIERRRFKRHDVIRSQGDPVREIFFLIEGWVACSIESANGARQIVKVHLPGDGLGGQSLALAEAAESLCALTSVVVVDVVPAERFGELFLSSPKLAAGMFLGAQQERIWLMDRLMSVGQTSAVQRLASFLLSIHDRLSAVQEEPLDSIRLPLSQEELASVLGITHVHANRTLMDLERTGLISREGRVITLVDMEGLRDFAGVPKRQFQTDPPWLQEALRRHRRRKGASSEESGPQS